MKTAVDQLIEKMSLEDVCKYSNELAEAKEMEKEQQIKFAKFHVESALKTASEEACTKYIPFSDDVEVDSNSILESYPLENIK
jgi:hypothetical protein